MLSANTPTLRQVNKGASFILADGMPMVWASRFRKKPLPERVTGADLLPEVCRQASELGHRVFLLGGGQGVAERAAQRLTQKYPGLQIVGILAPDMRTMSDIEKQQLIDQIRGSSADILFCAFSQPFGETWLAEHIDLLGVPVAFQIGASMDFAAGRIHRAPKWVQKAGLEWFYRISCEPMRLTPRYLKNGTFLIKQMLKTDLGMRNDN